MDTITHGLLGALCVRAGLPRRPAADGPDHARLLLFAAAAAAAPDIDYLGILVDPLRFIVHWHRGPTHSLVMLPLWAALLGWLASRRSGHFKPYALVAAVVLVTHILADLLTMWGTRIYWPLSEFRATVATTFVIDPYFTTLVLVALGVALPRRSPGAARVGVAMLLLYIALQAVLKQQAFLVADSYRREQGMASARVSVFPQPLSPFHWKLVVSVDEAHAVAFLDLLAADAPAQDDSAGSVRELLAGYRPADHLRWRRYHRFGSDPATRPFIRQAWAQEVMTPYRRFNQLPMLSGYWSSGRRRCARFADARFLLPIDGLPFQFGVCREADGQWRLTR